MIAEFKMRLEAKKCRKKTRENETDDVNSRFVKSTQIQNVTKKNVFREGWNIYKWLEIKNQNIGIKETKTIVLDILEENCTGIRIILLFDRANPKISETQIYIVKLSTLKFKKYNSIKTEVGKPLFLLQRRKYIHVIYIYIYIMLRGRKRVCATRILNRTPKMFSTFKSHKNIF